MITLMVYERPEKSGFRVTALHGGDAIALFDQWDRSRRFVINASGNRDPSIWKIIYRWASDHCSPNNPCFVRVVDDVVSGDDIDYPLGPQDQIPFPTPVFTNDPDEAWDDEPLDDDGLVALW